MPTYTYECKSCDNLFDVMRSLSNKSHQSCVSCGSLETKRKLSSPSFILKGDGWTGKNIKIKGQMREKNRRIAPKENEFARDSKEMKSMRIQPNVNGEQVDSWSEAQRLAQSQGKDASSYDSLVKKEKRGDL